MSVELQYPHIEKLAGEPALLQRVPRVRVAQIAMDYIAHGWSVEEMCRQHAYLRLAEAHSAMAYYFDHEKEINDEITADVALAKPAKSAAGESPLLLRLRAKRTT